MEFNLFLPQMRLSFDAAGRAGARRRGGRVRRASPAWTTWRRRWPTTSRCSRRSSRRRGSPRTPSGCASDRSCCATRSATRPCSRARRCRSTTRPAAASSSASDGVRCPRSSRRSASARPSRASASIGSARRWRSCARCGPARSSTTTASYHQLHGARQEPRPLGRIPIVIGGIGPKTLALVREFADWWNVHVGQLHKIDELRPQVGDARVSIQQMVALVRRERRSRGRHRARDATLRLVPAGHRHRRPSWSTTTGRWPSRASSASTRGSATSRRRRRSPSSAKTSSRRYEAERGPSRTRATSSKARQIPLDPSRDREGTFGNLQMFRPGDAGWFRWLRASATGASFARSHNRSPTSCGH